MTNEELLNDLKQFITATVSQEVDGLRKELKADIKALDQKLDAIQDAIAETLTHATEPLDATLQDHEQRLHRLEHRSA
jgi:rRNA-processing protein FCF1